MPTELFYHERSCHAFVVIPGCDTLDTLVMEIKLLENYLNIEPITCFEHQRISEGKYWGNSILKFPLHPSVIIEKDTWIKIDKENIESLKPEKPKLLTNL